MSLPHGAVGLSAVCDCGISRTPGRDFRSHIPVPARGKIKKKALGPWVAHLRMTDQCSGTICEIMVECIMRNNSVKLF